MKIYPLADHVMVRQIPPPELRDGSFVLVDAATDSPRHAEVVAVGPGRLDAYGKRIRPEIKKGDHILLRRATGTLVSLDGQEYVILREDEILGIVGH